MKMKTQQPKLVGHYKSSAKGKFMAIQAHLKKQEKSQINNLTLHLKQLETNITDEHRCKNPQQNSSNQNPTTH